MNRILLIAVLFTNTFLVNSCAQNQQQNSASNTPNKAFIDYIHKNGHKPAEYVISKLKKYNLVMIGEDHWIKNHPDFTSKLLTEISRDTSVHLDYFAFEHGSFADQDIADEFINSPVYQEDLVIQILRRAPDIYGWPYLEDVHLFKTIWEINARMPSQEKIKILLMDKPSTQAIMDGEKVDPCCYDITRDMAHVQLLRYYILSQKKHGIFYAGLGHTAYVVRGRYSKRNDFYWNQPSAGLLLKMLYPSQVFSIKLWGAKMGDHGYPGTDPAKWERLFNGRLDTVFRKNDNKPVAFDINQPPFSDITSAEFFMTPIEELEKDKSTGSPYRKTNLLKDEIDGIIFFKPLEEYSGSIVDSRFFDDEFMKKIEKRTGGKIKTRKELYEHLETIHPILSESLDSLLKKELK